MIYWCKCEKWFVHETSYIPNYMKTILNPQSFFWVIFFGILWTKKKNFFSEKDKTSLSLSSFSPLDELLFDITSSKDSLLDKFDKNHVVHGLITHV